MICSCAVYVTETPKTPGDLWVSSFRDADSGPRQARDHAAKWQQRSAMKKLVGPSRRQDLCGWFTGIV